MQDQPIQTESLPLRDIHLPEAISWWPPAPGWWLLLSIIVFIAASFFIIRKFHQKKQLQKTVLAELQAIHKNYENNNNRKVLVQSLSVLLRRASISFYPRNDVASLTGEKWLQYLDSTADTKGFNTSEGHLLITVPYLPDGKVAGIKVDSLISLCNSWILSQPKKQSAGNQS